VRWAGVSDILYVGEKRRGVAKQQGLQAMRPFFWLVFVRCALTGCREDEDATYLECSGGGFIFNYRNAEVF